MHKKRDLFNHTPNLRTHESVSRCSSENSIFMVFYKQYTTGYSEEQAHI